MAVMRYREALNAALREELERDPNVMLMGEDIGVFNGAFKVTDGLLARATRSNTVPKFFHVLTDSEYFNRAGSLVHTDVTGTRDVPPPPRATSVRPPRSAHRRLRESRCSRRSSTPRSAKSAIGQPTGRTRTAFR